MLFGFDSVAPRILDEGIRVLRERKEDSVNKELLIFWLREEVRYNLELMDAWRIKAKEGGSGKFQLDDTHVLTICKHLRVEVASVILSDAERANSLRKALPGSEIEGHLKPPKGEITDKPLKEEKEQAAERVKDGVELTLWILRKVSVLRVLAQECGNSDAGLDKKFRFGVRVQNIYNAYRGLFELLNSQ